MPAFGDPASLRNSPGGAATRTRWKGQRLDLCGEHRGEHWRRVRFGLCSHRLRLRPKYFPIHGDIDFLFGCAESGDGEITGRVESLVGISAKPRRERECWRTGNLLPFVFSLANAFEHGKSRLLRVADRKRLGFDGRVEIGNNLTNRTPASR